MWPPAVVWGGGPRLLPAGRPHLVQELQRSPHPGPLGQNLHRLLTELLPPPNLQPHCYNPTDSPRVVHTIHITDRVHPPCFVLWYKLLLVFFFICGCSVREVADIAAAPSGGLLLPLHSQKDSFSFSVADPSDDRATTWLFPPSFKYPTTFSVFFSSYTTAPAFYTQLSISTTEAWPAGSLGST